MTARPFDVDEWASSRLFPNGRRGGVLHADFQPAVLRGVTKTDGRVIGISFDLADGAVARFAFPLSDAVSLADGILEFAFPYRVRMNFHSEISSGNPSLDESTLPGSENV